VKDFNHALRIEKHIKRMKSKTFIQNLKKYPELLEKTVAKTHT
jgi:putative endonuclease